MATYAVKWREPDGRLYVGRLAFDREALDLDGREVGLGEPPVRRRFTYGELRSPRVGSGRVERLAGRPAVAIEGSDGTYLVADAGLGAPIVRELVERLAALYPVDPWKATVIVPLRDGAIEDVRELVTQRSPFDLRATAVTRHELLLTSGEALFVFETATEAGLGRLLHELDTLAATPRWSALVAGPPRLADVVYAWERPEVAERA